jgi:Flp pilus assembly protein TadD
MGCQDTDIPLVNTGIVAEKASALLVSSVSHDDKMYHTLAAEMYRLNGDDATATLHYEKIIKGNTDLGLAKIATETAAQTEHLALAVANAKHWVSLSEDQVEARQYLALLLLRSDDFDAAAAELHTINQRINEAGHDGLSFIASLISLESHKGQAFNAFETYVKSYNNSPAAQLKLAELTLNQHSSQLALDRLDQLNKELTTEEQEESMVLRSKALHKLGRADESIEIMSILVDKPEVDDMTRLEYARLLMLNGDELGATDQLQLVYLNTPTNLEVLKSLVGLRISQGEFQQAEDYAKTLADNVAYASVAHHYLAEIHESRNEMDEAIRAYGSVGSGDYFNSAQQRISELLVEQYSLDIATNWLSEARNKVNSDEKRFLYWRLDAKLRASYEDKSGALNAYRRAYQLDSSNNRMNYQYAITAQNANEIPLAEELLLEMLERNPTDANIFNTLGYMLLENTKRLDDAEAYITKAHELRPNDAIIIDSLGWLYFKQGKVKEAAALLMDAYEKTEDPEIATHLIEVLLTQGQTQEAIALLARVMEQYPNDEHLKSIKKKIIDI